MNTSNKFHLNEALEVNILIGDFKSCIVTIALSTVDSLPLAPCRRFFYKANMCVCACVCNKHCSRISMLHKNFDFQRQVPLFPYLFRRGIACKVSICVLCRTHLYSCIYLFPMNQVTVDSMQSSALIIIHCSFTWRPACCEGVLANYLSFLCTVHQRNGYLEVIFTFYTLCQLCASWDHLVACSEAFHIV